MDNAIVAYSYSNLGLYYHTSQYFSKAFEAMHRSVRILQSICGDLHPDICSVYMNMGLMYQEVEQYEKAIECFKEALFRNCKMYGD